MTRICCKFSQLHFRKMASIYIICFLTLASFGQTYSQIKVTLYYESMCPYCSSFMVRQLAPTYRRLGASNIILDLVPFGHGKQETLEGVTTFSCQHGVWECFGNKVHACVLNMNLGQDRSLNYIDCVMSNTPTSSVLTLSECAAELGLNWNTIYECATSAESTNLLSDYGARTHQFFGENDVKIVPALAFNDSYNSTLQHLAVTDLLGTVCSMFIETPAGCFGSKKK